MEVARILAVLYPWLGFWSHLRAGFGGSRSLSFRMREGERAAKKGMVVKCVRDVSGKSGRRCAFNFLCTWGCCHHFVAVTTLYLTGCRDSSTPGLWRLTTPRKHAVVVGRLFLQKSTRRQQEGLEARKSRASSVAGLSGGSMKWWGRGSSLVCAFGVVCSALHAHG